MSDKERATRRCEIASALKQLLGLRNPPILLNTLLKRIKYVCFIGQVRSFEVRKLDVTYDTQLNKLSCDLRANAFDRG